MRYRPGYTLIFSSRGQGSRGKENPKIKEEATTIPTLKYTTIDEMIDALSDIIAAANLGTADCIGLRGLYTTETDTTLAPSYIWEDGESTGEQLDGTSALLVAGTWEYATWAEIEANLKYALNNIVRYGDGRYAVIAGRLVVDAIIDDPHEVIIADARVIANIEIK